MEVRGGGGAGAHWRRNMPQPGQGQADAARVHAPTFFFEKRPKRSAANPPSRLPLYASVLMSSYRSASESFSALQREEGGGGGGSRNNERSGRFSCSGFSLPHFFCHSLILCASARLRPLGAARADVVGVALCVVPAAPVPALPPAFEERPPAHNRPFHLSFFFFFAAALSATVASATTTAQLCSPPLRPQGAGGWRSFGVWRCTGLWRPFSFLAPRSAVAARLSAALRLVR